MRRREPPLRDLDAPHTLTIDLPHGHWQLASAQLYAPDDLVTPIGDAAIALVNTDVELQGDRLATELPPHCLLALALTR